MHINRRTGWLDIAQHIESPNQDPRPPGATLDLIVVHGISLPPGEFGGPHIDEFFCNRLDCSVHPYFDEIRDMKVSAHVMIRRRGELVQYVPFHRRAWHAGSSCYRGRTECNDFSIGIELEGFDEIPYEPVQYQQLARLVSALIRAYPTLSVSRIVGHCDIAPGRKTDPGQAFDWARLRRLLDQGDAES